MDCVASDPADVGRSVRLTTGFPLASVHRERSVVYYKPAVRIDEVSEIVARAEDFNADVTVGFTVNKVSGNSI